MVVLVIFNPPATDSFSESSYSAACTVSEFSVDFSGRGRWSELTRPYLELESPVQDFKQENMG